MIYNNAYSAMLDRPLQLILFLVSLRACKPVNTMTLLISLSVEWAFV